MKLAKFENYVYKDFKGLKSWQRNISNQQFFNILQIILHEVNGIKVGECDSIDRDI